MLGVICTPKLTKRAADLSDRAARAERLAMGGRRFASVSATRRTSARACSARAESRVCADARCALALSALDLGIDVEQLDSRSDSSSVNRFTPTMTRSPDSTSVWWRNADASISACTNPCSIAATAPPRSSTLAISSRARCSSSAVSASTKKEPAERVGGVGRARLGREDLLRSQRDRGRVLGGQRQRLVERVGVERLRAAAHRRERLDRDSHDVVLRLLRGERRAACLRVEAKRDGARVRRAEAIAHDLRPEAARRAELRDLLEEVVVRVEEEREALAEGIRREAGGDGCFAVGDAVRERERELLRGARSRLADVVPGDRDRVPLGSRSAQYAKRSVASRIEGRGGKM